MKKKNLWIIALVAIMTIAFVGCGGNDDPTPETFTVTFMANGGTPELPVQTVEKGSKINEPSITKENSILNGWYKENTFSNLWNFASDTVTANIDLYAKWLCNCPNGTLHLVGETCCESIGCICEKNVVGQRVNGIPVTNRQNISSTAFNTQVGEIELAFSWLSSEQLSAMGITVKEFKVIPGPVTGLPTINSQGIFTVEAGSMASDIWGVLDGTIVVN